MNRTSSLPISVSDGPVSTPRASEEIQNSSHKPLFIFLGLIAFLAVGLGGVLLGKYLYGPKTPPVVPSATPTPPSDVSTPTPDPTANWKIYRNDGLGISFKYPLTTSPTGDQEVRVISEETNKIIIGVPQTDMAVFIRTYDNSSGQSVLSWLKAHPAPCPPEEPNSGQVPIQLAGESGVAIDCNIYKQVFLSHKQKIIVLSGTNDKSNGNLFVDQILSTFRFLDSDDIIIDWQTYFDQDTGYSIRYPAGWKTVRFQGTSKGVGIGPKEVAEDVLWAVNVYDTSQKSRQAVIDEIGNQFLPDRKQTQELITVNGVGATKVTTTTEEIKDWYSMTILIENMGRIITISNGAIGNEKLVTFPGVPEGLTFEDFYNTFKLF